jgi:hypothetical protein
LTIAILATTRLLQQTAVTSDTNFSNDPNPHYASAGEKSNRKIEDRKISTFSSPEVADPFNMQGESEASSGNRKLTEKFVDRKIVLRDLHDVSVKQFFCHSFLRCALIARSGAIRSRGNATGGARSGASTN